MPRRVASARARVSSCLAYSASGRVSEGDVRIASNAVAEGYVTAVLDPEARMERLRSEGEAGARTGGGDRRARGRGSRGGAPGRS